MNAGIAQLVEHRSEEAGVGSANLPPSTKNKNLPKGRFLFCVIHSFVILGFDNDTPWGYACLYEIHGSK